MTTRSSDAAREYYEGNIAELPVIASDIIYAGSAVGDNGSGYARPLVAGDPFRGFADDQADNSAGAAGAINVRCRKAGFIKLPISSLAITDHGKDVFASDDDTFTLTQGSNTRIGYVSRWLSTGYGVIHFRAAESALAELTDSSTGSADGTVADVGGAFSQATLNNNFADVTAKINALIRRLGN